MKDQILFSEKQRFTQWWLWAILILTNAMFFLGFYQQIIMGAPFGNNPMGDTGLVVVSSLFLLLGIFFLVIRMETTVQNEGISVRFTPFQMQSTLYLWQDIAEVKIVSYSPLKDFGGWGLRFSFSGRGKAYIMSGDKGLQIVFNTDNKLVIGTNKAEELSRILAKLNKIK